MLITEYVWFELLYPCVCGGGGGDGWVCVDTLIIWNELFFRQSWATSELGQEH